MADKINVEGSSKVDVTRIGLSLDHQLVWKKIHTAGYKWYDGAWRKGSSIMNSVDLSARMSSQFEDYAPKQVVGFITELESNLDKIEQSIKEEEDKIFSDFDLWLEAWGDLIKSRFSAVDERIWGGLRHSRDAEGTTIVVCPTGVANEYKIVGRKAEEVHEWMSAMDVFGGVNNRLSAIERSICDVIIEHTQGKPMTDYQTPIEIVDGTMLSAAAALALYDKAMAYNRDGKVIGFKLVGKGKISVYDYIECSFESFLACDKFRTKPLADISNDISEPCLRYIDTGARTGDWTTWKQWMNETFELACAIPVFMAWLGCLLDAKNTGKQAVWLHGHGNDGKSKVADALIAYLGRSARAIGGKSMGNQFGLSKLEGKRLVIVSDAKNQKLLQSEWAHNLTGGDSVDVERKGKDGYSAKLIGKLLVCANISPEIRVDEVNQVTRLIYIKMRKRNEAELLAKKMAVRNADGSVSFVGNSTWPERLKTETESFLAECYRTYCHLAPTRSDIPQPTEMVEYTALAAADPRSEAVADMIDSVFDFDADAIISCNDALSAMQVIEKSYGINVRNGFDLSEINTYLSNQGVTKERPPADSNGKRQRVYRGIRLKEIEQGL